jgi:hypothetical protein
MTASVGQEVDANLLRGAALGSAQARAEPQDAGGQDLGDLVEAFGRGHQVGVEGIRAEHCTSRQDRRHPAGSGGKLTSVR